MTTFQNGAPSPSSGKKKNNFSAAIVTIIICLILAGGAVLISLLNPNTDFDFIPSLIGPGETHYSDMEYIRPDAAALTEDITALITMIGEKKSFTEQSRLFTTINEDLVNFRTMMSLAEIRYYTDTTDEFYKTENELLSNEYIGVYDKICELLDAIEASTYKTNYERSYFGVGYFNDWTPMNPSDEVTELMKKEQQLITDYQSAISSATVNYNGREISIPSDEFYALEANDYNAVLSLYFQKYNEELGEIYAELVRTRLAIAKAQDKDYISIAYKDLGRDFTQEEANAYIDSIIEHLLPAFTKLEVDNSPLYDTVDTTTSFYHLALATSKMGGTIEEAFDYMVKYGLYEISYSENKQGLSFEIFLEKYYSPFLFTSSSKTADDFLTYAHEFGHFADDYVNLGAGRTIDNAEIASQAMAYIVPLYSGGMGNVTGEEFLKLNIYSTMEMYMYSCFVNKFETAVYALSPEEVSLEKLNSLAKQAALDAGFNEYAAESVAMGWFEIQHVYIAPMYYVGYAISNDAALQVLEAELKDPGEGGIKAFEKIIDRETSRTFVENITSAGFESPFAEGRAEKLATLIDGIFNPPAEDSGSGEGAESTTGETKKAA